MGTRPRSAVEEEVADDAEDKSQHHEPKDQTNFMGRSTGIGLVREPGNVSQVPSAPCALLRLSWALFIQLRLQNRVIAVPH